MHTLPRLRDRLNECELNHQRQVRVAISSVIAGSEYYEKIICPEKAETSSVVTDKPKTEMGAPLTD